MKVKKLPFSRLWMGVFLIWLVFLSGGLTPFTGTPGVLQVLKLNQLHSEKRNELEILEASNSKIKKEIENLETNRWFQEREVRRVLGYAAVNEIVFDFNSDTTDPVRQPLAN